MSELKAVHAFDVYEAYTKTGDDDVAQVYLKSEADKVIADLQSKVTLSSLAEDCSNLRNKRCNYCSALKLQKDKADKLISCLKCLVKRDLIKDCPEKKSAIEIVKEYK